MIDVNSETVVKIKERYNQIYPLIVHRSVERSKTPGGLFDILDRLWKEMQTKEKIVGEDGTEIEIPKEIFPIVWHEEEHRWVTTDDLFQSVSFLAKQKEQK